MGRARHLIQGVQLSFVSGVAPYELPDEPASKTVLGGQPKTETLQGFQVDEKLCGDAPLFSHLSRQIRQEIVPPALNSESRACGWLEEKTTERKRKNRDPWICKQWWLHWEEPGGRKRSRYVPKAKLADVEHSIYRLKRPIQETLELLGKKK